MIRAEDVCEFGVELSFNPTIYIKKPLLNCHESFQNNNTKILRLIVKRSPKILMNIQSNEFEEEKKKKSFSLFSSVCGGKR